MGRIGPRDRGAVAIIVAIGLIGLIAFGAYVIDVGAMFEERRDLQTGAEAAALAAATDAAETGVCDDSSAAAYDQAQTLASRNANDGKAWVLNGDIVCDGNEVTVTARTWDDVDNDGEINFVLAPVIGNDSKAVSAVASATWGAISGTQTTVPIIFSSCEWSVAMGIDDPVNNPPTADDFPSEYRKIYLHDDNANGGGGGQAAPPQCKYGPGQDVDGNPGSLGCQLSDIKGQKLLVPVFDDIPDNGNPCGAPPGQPCYHVFGFATFDVEDVDLTGGQWRNNGNICNANQRCLGGRFTDFVLLEDWNGGGTTSPPLGPLSVRLSG
jgi:Flp pilus assembly protein TadG